MSDDLTERLLAAGREAQRRDRQRTLIMRVAPAIVLVALVYGCVTLVGRAGGPAKFTGNEAALYRASYMTCRAFGDRKIGADFGIEGASHMLIAHAYAIHAAAGDDRQAASEEGCLDALDGRPQDLRKP